MERRREDIVGEKKCDECRVENGTKCRAMFIFFLPYLFTGMPAARNSFRIHEFFTGVNKMYINPLDGKR